MKTRLALMIASLTRAWYQVRNWKAHWRALVKGTKVYIPLMGRQEGLLSVEGQLSATIIRKDGLEIDLGVISRRVVTTAGVNFVRDDFFAGANGADVSNMNFHDSGTGTNAEAVGDTDLQTVGGPTTRATGAQSAPATKQYRSSGTITYAGALAITEHGIFNQAARGAGSVLFDRSVFAAINVGASDSILFQYTLTINDGG